MQFPKRHGFIDGTGDATNFVAALGKRSCKKICDYRLIFRDENPEHLSASGRICPCKDWRNRPDDFIDDPPESALCSDALGTPWWDQKQGKPYSNGRSNAIRFRRSDRAAELAHEDSHVIGATFLWNLRQILVLHAHTVIGNGQLDLVADLFHAQHDTPGPAGESVL